VFSIKPKAFYEPTSKLTSITIEYYYYYYIKYPVGRVELVVGIGKGELRTGFSGKTGGRETTWMTQA
jgi:hypothetical protein